MYICIYTYVGGGVTCSLLEGSVCTADPTRRKYVELAERLRLVGGPHTLNAETWVLSSSQSSQVLNPERSLFHQDSICLNLFSGVLMLFKSCCKSGLSIV